MLSEKSKSQSNLIYNRIQFLKKMYVRNKFLEEYILKNIILVISGKQKWKKGEGAKGVFIFPFVFWTLKSWPFNTFI